MEVVFDALSLPANPIERIGNNKANEKTASTELLVMTNASAYAAGKTRVNIKDCPLDAERIRAEPRPTEINPPNISAGRMGDPTKYAENTINMIVQIAPEILFDEKKRQMPQKRHAPREM